MSKFVGLIDKMPIYKQARQPIMQNTPENLDLKGRIWTEREFAYADQTIRLVTSFSGFGAIEHAVDR